MRKQIRNQLLPFERLTKEPSHYFRSYYDQQHWSPDGHFLLCHKTEFRDRLQTAADRIALGMIRVGDRTFVPLAETYAWNFQQGAMLQWNPACPEREIVYNARYNEGYRTVVQDIFTGEKRILSRPIRTITPDGKWGLSLNFSRIFGQRPGYGYAGIPDGFREVRAPEDDGIFLVDMQSGESRLILSVEAARQYLNDIPEKDVKLLINAATFNTDGSRFLFLVRTMERPPGVNPAGGWWKTAAFTANTDGTDIHRLIDFGMVSHNNWRDPENLLVYAAVGGTSGLFLLEDRTSNATRIGGEFFRQDGHCSYSPDRRFVLYDSYPNADGYRKIFLYDLAKQEGVVLAELLSEALASVDCVDIRCDLHPSWNRDGTAITFDSVHEGHRHIYWMDVREFVS